ncbi:hypothetical protein CSKR_203685 [Clonorchis sinensis]|uniref:Uncharacterized protein n=1 Tax=Clonorchis sinensis TaxID=79923 RepID=A0A8T1N072_CLOSI|nr:hypothetical protein CSKR_203685 [Clonorchis sinensis]
MHWWSRVARLSRKSDLVWGGLIKTTAPEQQEVDLSNESDVDVSAVDNRETVTSSHYFEDLISRTSVS